MSASDASAMDTSREAEDTATGSDEEREEIRVLMSLAGAYEGVGADTGHGVTHGELDDEAMGRRAQGILRCRSSEDMSVSDGGAGAADVPMGPPVRFVRRLRIQREGPATQVRQVEAEPRSLIVSSLYPSFRTSGAPVRTVRWGRKRKLEPSWDGGRRAAYGHSGPGAGPGAGADGRRDRAKGLEGSTVYI